LTLLQVVEVSFGSL